MAIRNTLLGGTDWNGEAVTDYDLNDTFNAAYNLARQNPVFWLNSNFYNVYDDFESYSTGAFTSNAKWTVSVAGGSSSCTIASSTTSGGTGKELILDAVSGAGDNNSYDVIVNTETNLQNGHVHIRGYVSLGSTNIYAASFAVQLGTSGYTTITTSGSSTTRTHYVDILIVALGSNLYDVYVNSKKIISSYNGSSNRKLYLKVSSGGSNAGAIHGTLYIDDVRESAVSI